MAWISFARKTRAPSSKHPPESTFYRRNSDCLKNHREAPPKPKSETDHSPSNLNATTDELYTRCKTDSPPGNEDKKGPRRITDPINQSLYSTSQNVRRIIQRNDQRTLIYTPYSVSLELDGIRWSPDDASPSSRENRDAERERERSGREEERG